MKRNETRSQQTMATVSPLTRLNNRRFDASACTVTHVPEHYCHHVRKDQRQLAFVIENVLSPEECAQWIEDTENLGYEPALVNVGNGRQSLISDVRKSSRYIVDDEERAKELWERVKGFLPPDLRFGGFVPRELNERLRFLRYDPGDYFVSHFDGSYRHPSGHPKAGDRSYLTLQLYLNEGFEGGTTRLFADSRETDYFDVVPKTGSVFIFEHVMNHAGELLIQGRKYTVRTDIMFTNRVEDDDAVAAVSTKKEGAPL